jgi:hypothetical protein
MSGNGECPAEEFVNAIDRVMEDYKKRYEPDTAFKLTASANGKEIQVEHIWTYAPTLVRFCGPDKDGNYCEIMTHVNAAQVVLAVPSDAKKKQIKMA